MFEYICLRYGPHHYTEAGLKTVTAFRYEDGYVNMSFRGGGMEIAFPVRVEIGSIPETVCNTPADLYTLITEFLEHAYEHYHWHQTGQVNGEYVL